MRSSQSTVLETLRRMQGFLDTHPTLVASVNQSGARTELDSVATQLTAQATTQETGTRGSKGQTAKQKSLRRTLRVNYMHPIAEIAKHQLRTVPEFKALQMPKGSVTQDRLIAAAGAMADAAALHAATFTTAGMAADFVAQLRTAVQAVETGTSVRIKHRTSRTGATTGLVSLAKQGRSLVRVVDALVRPLLGTDDVLLGAWNQATGLKRKPRLAIANAPATVPAAAAVAAPVATATASAPPASTAPPA